jgi:hypothetical protein
MGHVSGVHGAVTVGSVVEVWVGVAMAGACFEECSREEGLRIECVV